MNENEKNFRKYIALFKRCADLMEQCLNEGIVLPSPEELMGIQPETSVVKCTDREIHIKTLMEIDCWPEAIKKRAKSETSTEDLINQAISVLDSQLIKPIDKLDFLDFGCGNGYLAKEAVLRGATVTGFDIQPNETWSDPQGVTFTVNSESLESYDVIFLHDVIDHALDAENVMRQVKKLLKPNGLVYVRCHPWTSKHAVHLANEGLNKAFIHLFLTTEELITLGYKPMFTRQEKNPLLAYKWFFHDFKVIKERVQREPISDFFLVPAFKELVINEQQIPKERHIEFFKDMEIVFVEYVLVNNV